MRRAEKTMTLLGQQEVRDQKGTYRARVEKRRRIFTRDDMLIRPM
jgi:hypothetical protein